jgi:hypothetical protein
MMNTDAFQEKKKKKKVWLLLRLSLIQKSRICEEGCGANNKKNASDLYPIWTKLSICTLYRIPGTRLASVEVSLTIKVIYKSKINQPAGQPDPCIEVASAN